MKSFLSALALATAVSAHTTFQYFQVGGVDYDKSYIRGPSNNNPITNVASSDMACNVGGNSPVAKKATISAGSSFTAEFHHEGRSSQGVDPSHKGPTIAYLAKVDNALTTPSSGLSWFKIFEDGYSGGKWAVDKFNANGGKWSFTIPTAIPNGDYLLRAETIALHSASSYEGAQLYFGCAQITITGGSGGSPSPTVSFPGAYKGTDPGITFNLYAPSINYIIPGPAVYKPGSSNPNPGTTTVRTTSTTVRTSAGPTTTASSGSAPLYGQCGGIGWTGPTTCASGTCKKSGDYYSQCLP